MGFPSYPVLLRRRHDKGKPDESPGRKATGPSRAAELPNVEEARPTLGPSSEERRGASAPPRTNGRLVGLGTFRSSTCPPARDRPCADPGAAFSPEAVRMHLQPSKEQRNHSMKKTRNNAQTAISRSSAVVPVAPDVVLDRGGNHEETRACWHLASAHRAAVRGVGEPRARWKEERNLGCCGDCTRWILRQGDVRTAKVGELSPLHAPRSRALALGRIARGFGSRFASAV